jgi:hypothetical protein
MAKRQTAVEWLVDEIRNHIKENGRLDAITISEFKMKAKAMEKEQILSAFDSAACWYDDFSEYYTSTYGQ